MERSKLQLGLELERKAINLDAVLNEREFIAYIATFDVDLVGDRIARGAIANAEEFVRDGFITVSHDWAGLPVASVLEIAEDDTGILLRGRFHMHPLAEVAYSYVRERVELGKSVKFSIGFYVLQSHDETVEGRVVRVLDRIALVEASLVNVPANPNTRLVAVKEREDVHESKAQEVLDVPASLEPSVEPPIDGRALRRKYYTALLAEILEGAVHKQEEDWVVGGARDLELIDDDSWDVDEAEAAVRRLCGGDPTSEDFDWETYHKAHVVYNRAKPRAITSHKLLFCKVRNNELVASRRGLIAVRVVLSGGRGGVNLPEDIIERAKKFVVSYLDKEEEE